MSDELELAWAAGLFDGEGHTGFSRPAQGWRGRIQIDVSQCDPEVLHRFAAAVGMGTVTGPYSNGRFRPAWKYRAQGEAAVRIMRLLWPYLSTAKREQATAAAALFDAQPAPKTGKGTRRATCMRGHEWVDPIVERSGKRKCRLCENAKQRRQYERRRAQKIYTG